MSASIYLYSEFDDLNVVADTSAKNPTLWIRTWGSPSQSVGLVLNAADRAKLRAALDEIDAHEAQQAEPAREAA